MAWLLAARVPTVGRVAVPCVKLCKTCAVVSFLAPISVASRPYISLRDVSIIVVFFPHVTKVLKSMNTHKNTLTSMKVGLHVLICFSQLTNFVSFNQHIMMRSVETKIKTVSVLCLYDLIFIRNPTLPVPLAKRTV